MAASGVPEACKRERSWPSTVAARRSKGSTGITSSRYRTSCCLPPLRHQLIEIPLITPFPWPKAVWHQGVADQPSELVCNRRTNILRW